MGALEHRVNVQVYTLSPSTATEPRGIGSIITPQGTQIMTAQYDAKHSVSNKDTVKQNLQANHLGHNLHKAALLGWAYHVLNGDFHQSKFVLSIRLWYLRVRR